jgi:hypothetical protein
VHASNEKSEDSKNSFCEELEQVFDHFPTYHVKILLGGFSAQVGIENIFKPAVGIRVYRVGEKSPYTQTIRISDSI